MSKNTDLSSLINYVKGASTGQLIAPSYTSASSFTGTIAGYLGFDSSGNILTISSASQWITSGSNIYYNSGNVGIGTTDTSHPLVIAAGSTNFTMKLIGASGTNRSLIMFYPNNGLGAGYATIGADATSFYISASNTSFLDLGGFGGGGIRIIASNGRVLIGSTTDQGAYLLQVNSQIWATNSTIATSDLRLKENVADLDSSLNLLMGMKSRTFSYKQNTEFNFTEKGITVGFIAQELKELFEGTKYANSIVVEAGKYYGVAYEKIIPLLVKGIQELKIELDELKANNQ
jgi:hypothetical protein